MCWGGYTVKGEENQEGDHEARRIQISQRETKWLRNGEPGKRKGAPESREREELQTKTKGKAKGANRRMKRTRASGFR